MRQFIRHPSDIPIEFGVVETDCGGIETMKDIGLGGLRFNSRYPVEVNSLLLVRIPGKEFRARARVVWCNPVIEDGLEHFDIGVNFIEQDDLYAVRMVEQVCHIEQYRQHVRETEGRVISGAEAASEWIKRFARDFPNPFTNH